MNSKRISKYLFIVILSTFILYSCGDEEQKKPTPTTTPQSSMTATKKADAQKDSMKAEPKKIEEEKPKKEMNQTSEIPNPYVVKAGDTLVSIAEKFYNDSGKWFYIFAENEDDINNWNKIYPGQKLVMPSSDEM